MMAAYLLSIFFKLSRLPRLLLLLQYFLPTQKTLPHSSHVIVCLHHFSVVVLGALRRYTKLLQLAKTDQDRGLGLVVAEDGIDTVKLPLGL